jgi:hypothetical protein
MEIRKFIEEAVRECLNERQILNEGSSDILYHFTYISNLFNILKKNELSLTSTIGSKSDYNVNKNRFYYLSTTRSKSSGYKKGDVKIVLDGRKIKQNNKITPVDYWQLSKNRNDYDSESAYSSALTSLEQEDRIVSDKPIIENAIKYIIEIHILIHTPNTELMNIINICKDNNLKLYLYDNKKNWLNQIKPISDDIDFSNIEDDKGWGERVYFDYDIASLIAYNDVDNYNIITKYLNDVDKIKLLDDTLKKRTYNNFRIGATYLDDGINYINSSLSRIRRYADKGSKFLLLLLTKELKKYGVNNIKDYLLKKQFKNKKTLNDFKKDLYNFLNSKMISELPDGLDKYFRHYIEIDGKYYNYAYDSDEIIKVVYKYITKIKEYLHSQIFSEENDIFKYSYFLDGDYIKKHIGFENIKLTKEINITDSFYDNLNDIDEQFKILISQYIIWAIDNSYYDKVKSLKSEYESQL